MKQIFLKNLYQAIAFAVSDLVLILFFFIAGASYRFQNEEVNRFVFSSIGILILLFFVIGFYWLFQTVKLDKEGISVRFFKKRLSYVEWHEIDSIVKGSVMRNPTITCVIQNKKNINLDDRKAIRRAIAYYSTENIRDKIATLM